MDCAKMKTRLLLVTIASSFLIDLSSSFTPSSSSSSSSFTSTFRWQGPRHWKSSTIDTTSGREGPIFDTPWTPEGSLEGLLQAAQKASIPCSAETTQGAHDAFRFEWGRWIDDLAMEQLMDRINEIHLTPGMYDTLIATTTTTTTTTTIATTTTTTTITNTSYNTQDDMTSTQEVPSAARRYRVAGGDYWDCILHVLPPGSEWRGRWPTGAWAVVKALTGVAEVAMLRGPNRNGFYTKATSKALRGGGDGTLAGGSAFGGEDCVKYVGGAFRSYAGKSGKTTLLEVVVRPPVGKEQLDGDGNDSSAMAMLENPETVLEVVLKTPQEEVDTTDSEDDQIDGDDNNDKPKHLGTKLGMTFEKVGGLDDQLNAIVRRVLASRANPEAAKKLGISHVRGILLSGPPGCGKTLLARELSRMLGAREPQIVNGPEILDKFVGEAEKNIRALFKPAEIEYAQVGDKSALHVIILDEMDAIARKRGSVTGDSTGVRDSVVNQLLAKMDGVKEANNILVVGLTNRPELLDPALLRPGRLEVQLRVELPDLSGRRDILRIHTRRMYEAGGLSPDAWRLLEDLGENGFPARTEYFTGAELAGLVRSAASFALARTVESENMDDDECGVVSVDDLETALKEVRPALGAQDELLEMRYPNGISAFSPSMDRVMRDLNRFISTPELDRGESRVPPKLESMMLVGSSRTGGSGATALACWAGAQASILGEASYVRLVTSLDLLPLGGGGDDAARAGALAEKFTEAREMSNAILILDDVDQMISGNGPHGYSSVMLATLRALLRSPPTGTSTSRAGGHSTSKKTNGGKEKARSLKVIAATSRQDAACVVLHELFDESLMVPQVSDKESIRLLVRDSVKVTGLPVVNTNAMADLVGERLGSVGCKTVLRLIDRAVAVAGQGTRDTPDERLQLDALNTILEDFVLDNATTNGVCEVF